MQWTSQAAGTKASEEAVAKKPPANADLKLAHRLRRRPNIRTTSVHVTRRHVLTGAADTASAVDRDSCVLRSSSSVDSFSSIPSRQLEQQTIETEAEKLTVEQMGRVRTMTEWYGMMPR